MISAFPTFDFEKLSFKLNAFVGGRNAKTNAFGRPDFAFAVSARTA